MLFGFRLVIDKVFIFDDLSIRKTVFYVNEITTAIQENKDYKDKPK
jgi:hypothetical protein